VIESGALNHVSDTLYNLCLENNSIKTIEPGAFKCLSKLRNLLLSGNQLTDEQLADLKTELPTAAIVM
jgi:Leucine-rich repeat (LRR) protein